MTLYIKAIQEPYGKDCTLDLTANIVLYEGMKEKEYEEKYRNIYCNL